MATVGVVTSLLLLLTAASPGQQRYTPEEVEDKTTGQPSRINPTDMQHTNIDLSTTSHGPSNSTIPSSKYQQTQEETDLARIQLEKIIENQRLANLRYQEMQLEQLRKAEVQLQNQIENQKQLQLTWTQKSNRSHESDRGRGNKKEEENLQTNVVEEDSKTEKRKDIALKNKASVSQTTELNEEANISDTANHWKTEEGNSTKSVKASNHLVVPDEVKDAVRKVSIHLIDQMSNNFTIPEYVFSALRE